MKYHLAVLARSALVIAFFALIGPAHGAAVSAYPPVEKRRPSPGHTTYYVHAAKGKDANSGLKPEEAWRSFTPVNALLLAPGDRVEVLGGGTFKESLMPGGAGSSKEPILIHFASGEYDFYPAEAIKLKVHASETEGDRDTATPIAWLFRGIRHVRLTGNNAEIFVHGKMIETMIDHADDVTFSGLAFDYRRSLISEFKIVAVTADHADVQVQWDSTYAIEKEKLVWIGEGWRSDGMGLYQECNPRDDYRTWRIGKLMAGVTKVVEYAPRRLRMFFTKNPGFTLGRIIQVREALGDVASGIVSRSKDIAFTNGAFYALGGMGIVHRFSENITYNQMQVAPRPDSGRTTCAWGGMLDFTACKGSISLDTVRFAGSRDAAVNVHGTKPADNDDVKNVTWMPSVEVRNCQISANSGGGFLLSTRGSIVIETSTFLKTAMSAIVIADDARSRLGSVTAGAVTIRGNRFVYCGGPAISIWPEKRTARIEETSQRNIHVMDNFFQGGGVSAGSVSGLIVTGNRFSGDVLVASPAGAEVKIEKNQDYAKQ